MGLLGFFFFALDESAWVLFFFISLPGLVYIRSACVDLFSQMSHSKCVYISWDDKGLLALDEFCSDQMSHPAFVYIWWVSIFFYVRGVILVLFISDESLRIGLHQRSLSRFWYIRLVSVGFISHPMDRRGFILHQMSVWVCLDPMFRLGSLYIRWVYESYFTFDVSRRVCLHQRSNPGIVHIIWGILGLLTSDESAYVYLD